MDISNKTSNLVLIELTVDTTEMEPLLQWRFPKVLKQHSDHHQQDKQREWWQRKLQL